MATNKKTATPAAKKETPAADTTKQAAPVEKKAKAPTSPVATLPAGTGTQNTAPPASAPPAIERGASEREAKAVNHEDTKRLPEDKARWNFGESTTTATLLAEQRKIDGK